MLAAHVGFRVSAGAGPVRCLLEPRTNGKVPSGHLFPPQEFWLFLPMPEILLQLH